VAAKEKAAHPEKATKAVAEKKTSAKPKTEAEEIADLLRIRYHRNLRAFVEWNNDDVMQTYLSSLARVYDPHTDYMGHAQLDQFGIAMNLSLFGIGAELGTDDGYCTIRRLLTGGPALKSKKIHERDRIVAVAQPGQPPVDLVEMSLTKAVQLIRGPKGTEVILTIIPADADPSAREVLSLIRDEIKLEDQAAKATILEIPNGHGETNRLGILDLPSFYAPIDLGGGRRPENGRAGDATSGSTTTDVARLLAKMKQEKVNGVVLDLRRNGGGSLEEAIRLTGLFIKEGPVVQVRDSDGNKQVDDDTDPSVAWDGPLIVLTSRFSASASEILAGALQDYGRALIVGDASTHGKGTVQSVNSLKPYMRVNDTILTNDPGALKVTIKKFYRASGASTQLKGVVPDIILPSIWNESKEIGEASLDNALPYDTIPSAKFERLDLVAPYLAELRRESGQRLVADQDFAYVREDIEQFKKLQADKTISLNEKQRLKEKYEADARVKARDKERLARKESPEVKHELTLKDVNLPGLPPPVQKTNTALVRLDHLKGSVGSVAAGSSQTASVTSAPATSPDTGVEDTPEDEKPPAIDATLTEAERILMDYMAAFPKHNLLTSGH
jgi:carboxyl-terminal processing protease